MTAGTILPEAREIASDSSGLTSNLERNHSLISQMNDFVPKPDESQSLPYLPGLQSKNRNPLPQNCSKNSKDISQEQNSSQRDLLLYHLPQHLEPKFDNSKSNYLVSTGQPLRQKPPKETETNSNTFPEANSIETPLSSFSTQLQRLQQQQYSEIHSIASANHHHNQETSFLPFTNSLNTTKMPFIGVNANNTNHSLQNEDCKIQLSPKPEPNSTSYSEANTSSELAGNANHSGHHRLKDTPLKPKERIIEMEVGPECFVGVQQEKNFFSPPPQHATSPPPHHHRIPHYSTATSQEDEAANGLLKLAMKSEAVLNDSLRPKKPIYDSNAGGYSKIGKLLAIQPASRRMLLANGGVGAGGIGKIVNSPTRRQAHIVSEQKRRQTINEGFDELRFLVPTCHNLNDSKATILKKTVNYLKLLQQKISELTPNEQTNATECMNEDGGRGEEDARNVSLQMQNQSFKQIKGHLKSKVKANSATRSIVRSPESCSGEGEDDVGGLSIDESC